MTEEKQTEDNQTKQHEGSVEIQFFTDPLCCWSWAFEPQWRRLRYEYSGKLKWRYRMAGLIPSWGSYSDPLNSVTKPIQMGPVWLEAKHLSGMPMDDKVWYHNPPSSSFPACMAVKCAGLQSPEAAEFYLRRLREAVMLHSRDISKTDTLLEVAKEIAKENEKLLDYATFEQELSGERTKAAFEEDLKLVRFHGITRYPALTITRPGEPGLLIIGYRHYEALRSTLLKVAPELNPVNKLKDAEAYSAFWDGVLDREAEEILESNDVTQVD